MITTSSDSHQPGQIFGSASTWIANPGAYLLQMRIYDISVLQLQLRAIGKDQLARI